ncbi:MAG: hypothetical protein ACN4GF_01655 [Lentimonas sp.]
MRYIKAFVYALMGFIMCWNTFQKGHYVLTIPIALFTLCAIAITLASIGTRQITWDESGITIRKFPAAPRHIPWSSLEKMRVDHLGYHVRTRNSTFKISTKNMPESLLEQIRSSIKAS